MFQAYIPPIFNASITPTSSIDSSLQCTSVGDNSISFDHTSHGKVAVLTADGIKCALERFPEKTSKEFAQMLFESLLTLVRRTHFERGKAAVKWTVAGKPALEIGERSLELHSTGTMSHFDQWVFIHLQKLWKDRKI
jgi:hypothetical protein